MRIIERLFTFVGTVLVLGATARGATITYFDKVLNNAPDAGLGGASMIGNYSTISASKAPYDANTDHFFGSDGYAFFGTMPIDATESSTATTFIQNPQFGTITPLTPYGGAAWYGGYGAIDDPTVSPHASPVADIYSGELYALHPAGQFSTVDFLSITLTQNMRFRIGVMQNAGDGQKGQELLVNGVSVSTLPGGAVNNYANLDMYFFDVQGSAGDVIYVQSRLDFTASANPGIVGIAGITLDAVPEPGGFCLMGLAAAFLSNVRRRQQISVA
jgi:hypothetical protein